MYYLCDWYHYKTPNDAKRYTLIDAAIDAAIKLSRKRGGNVAVASKGEGLYGFAMSGVWSWALECVECNGHGCSHCYDIGRVADPESHVKGYR